MATAFAKHPGARLEARGLSVRYGAGRVLSGVSFAARPGELIGILGPSGSGKSTLLSCLSGWMRPSKGEVRLDGRPLDEWRSRSAHLVGYVPQDDVVHRQLRLRKALQYAGALRLPHADGADVHRRAEAVLSLLDLKHRARARIGTLSGGERKRANIGVELVTEPRVLLLDEPTSGLDPALEERLMRLFRRLADDGRTIVLSTHVMGTLEVLDRVLMLSKGHMVYFGSTNEAAPFFGVSHLAEVYKRLARDEGGDWARRFRSSAQHRRYVEGQGADREPARDETR